MKRISIIFVFIHLSFSLVLGQDSITVDWIYNKDRIDQYSIPDFQWLEDGQLLLLNKRDTPEKRTFVKYDPRNEKSVPWLVMSKAVNSLVALTDDDSIQALDWPLDIDPWGKYAVYSFNRDLFLLEFSSARFFRVTDSPEREKAVRFSPDGKHISYVFNNNLFTYDIVKKQTIQLTSDGSETILNGTLSWVYWEELFGRRDIAYWWSNHSDQIAFLRTDETGVGVMHFVDFQPQTPRLIKQPYPKAGTKNPTVTVNVIDLPTGNIHPFNFIDHEYEYITRVQWLPGDQKISVQTMNRAQTEVDLFFCDPRGESKQFILTETDSAWVNIHDDLVFFPDGKHFLWTSERDGYAHIYRYDMDGKLVNRVTKGKWSLRSSGGRYWLRQSVLGYNPNSDFIYFIAQEKSPLERHLYQIKPDGTAMSRVTSQAGTHRIQMSGNFDYFVDTYSNSTTPPSLRCYNTTNMNGHELVSSKGQQVQRFNLQFPETFSIPASDGFPLPAQLLKPAGFDPNKKYPLILYVYGGPSAPTVANAWRTDIYYEQILLRKGYLVARVDPRSAAAISKQLENTILKQMSGPSELKDLADAVRWFKKQPFIDGNRIGIWGWSGGGSFTLNAMTNSDLFAAGISVAPVTDWHYYDTIWAEFGMKTPEQNPEGYKITSSVLSAGNLHGRLLLVHGTYDDNVHPQNSWHFIDELVKAGKLFEMMFYPMRKHSISDLPARRHLYKTMLEFWERNL